VFEEAASGGRWDRPELHRMLDQLREGYTVLVWKLDRLSRSLKEVLYYRTWSLSSELSSEESSCFILDRKYRR